MRGASRSACASGGAWVFGVGAGSGFYSPFWEMIYVEVPEGTPGPESLRRSARSSMADIPCSLGPGARWCWRRGPTWWCPLAPASAAAGSMGRRRRSSTSVRGCSPAGCRGAGPGHRRASPLRLRVPRQPTGAGRARRGSRGAGARTSPLGAVRATDVAGQPRYSAFWRLYRVTLPLNARAFAPGGYAGIDAALRAAGAPTVTSYGAITGPSRTRNRIWARSRSTRSTPPATPRPVSPMPNLLEPRHVASCHWLDAQLAIDSLLDPEPDRGHGDNGDRPGRHGPRHPGAAAVNAVRPRRSAPLPRRAVAALAGRHVAQPQPVAEVEDEAINDSEGYTPPAQGPGRSVAALDQWLRRHRVRARAGGRDQLRARRRPAAGRLRRRSVRARGEQPR